MNEIEKWPGLVVELDTGRQVYVRHTEAASSERPPIVYVHGLGGSATNWTALMAELKGDAPQWAIDLPGYGESPPAADHSVTAYAADVLAFLSRFDRPVHLVGNSMGGLVSVLAATSRPDLVATLTLLSPAMPQYRLPWGALATALMAIPGVGERLWRRTLSKKSAQRQADRFTAMLYADVKAVPWPHLRFADAERKRWMFLPHAGAVMLSSLRSIVAQYLRLPWRSPWLAVRRLSSPTLVVLAGKDIMVGPWGADNWRKVPAARVVHLPNSGHIPMMEHPRLVGDVVREFFREVPPNTSPGKRQRIVPKSMPIANFGAASASK